MGGDAPTEELVRRWSRERRFVNAYGPTESTILVSLRDCYAEDDGDPAIGRPIANTRMYIVDAYAQLSRLGSLESCTLVVRA